MFPKQPSILVSFSLHRFNLKYRIITDYWAFPCKNSQISIIFFFLCPTQIIMSVVISNVTLVDNGLGIMSLIYAPPSVSHKFADKPVHIQVRRLYYKSCFVLSSRAYFHISHTDSDTFSSCSFFSQNALIVGSSPNFNCLDTLSNSDFNLAISDSHRAPRPLNGTVTLRTKCRCHKSTVDWLNFMDSFVDTRKFLVQT